MRIRVARAGDLGAIMELEKGSFRPSDRFPRRVWRHLLGPAARRHSALTLLAADRGRILGAITGLYRRGSRTVRVYSIAVDPDRRGSGIGARLMAALAQRSHSCDCVCLEVRADSPARRLYERIGLSQAERLPGYYGARQDGVRYRGAVAAVRGASKPRR
jgi:[ribosomal protein S18]-alanine N-acetyltransferase